MQRYGHQMSSQPFPSAQIFASGISFMQGQVPVAYFADDFEYYESFLVHQRVHLPRTGLIQRYVSGTSRL